MALEKSFIRLVALVVVTAALACVAPASAQTRAPADPVKIDSGLVTGKLLASGVRAFLGMPYARPPVGEQRWREPAAATSWKGTYHADRMAPECIQPLRAHKNNQYFGEEATSEDCLYLNVWVPAGAGLALQKSLNVKSVAEMRDLPADRILQGSLTSEMLSYSPVIDGYAIPSSLDEVFAGHRQHDVALMVGLTADETFHPISRARTVAEYSALAKGLFGDGADQFIKLYPAENDAALRKTAVEAGRDLSLGSMMRTRARASLGKGKSPVYAYVFDKSHSYMAGVRIADLDPATAGAYHTSEVPYWLQTLDSFNAVRETRNWGSADRKLSDAMSNALIAFAATGNPGTAALPWARYDLNAERVLVLGETIATSAWPNREKIEAARSLAAPKAAGP